MGIFYGKTGLEGVKILKIKKYYFSTHFQQICNTKQAIHAITLNFSQNANKNKLKVWKVKDLAVFLQLRKLWKGWKGRSSFCSCYYFCLYTELSYKSFYHNFLFIFFCCFSNFFSSVFSLFLSSLIFLWKFIEYVYQQLLHQVSENAILDLIIH